MNQQNPRTSPARDWALSVLDSKPLPNWPVDSLRRNVFSPTDARDHALAEQIIVGTVKNLLQLQHLTTHYSGRPPGSIEPAVQKIIAIGLYQLRFLTRVPASAVVDEAVEQTRRFGRPKASGFVNAILRRATREPNPPLPDRTDPHRFATMLLSHPAELFDRMVQLLGTEDALRLCEHDNAEPPTIVRSFGGRSVEELSTPDVKITPHEQSGMYVVEPAKVPLLARWAQGAVAQVQDPTAAMVAEMCDVQAGQSVLDRCAGLGTKTVQLREKLGDAGRIVAMDSSAARCETLAELVRQRSLHNVEVIHANFLNGLLPPLGQFDLALVDAPCSNSGVFARRPEARYTQDERSLASLRRLQADIVDDTAPAVREGGLLVYSTCSIWPEENQMAVDAFLSRHPDYVLTQTRVTLPSLVTEHARYRDGGFVAVLRRIAH